MAWFISSPKSPGKRTLIDISSGVLLAYPVFLGAQTVFLANVILNLVRRNRTHPELLDGFPNTTLLRIAQLDY